MPVVVSNNFSQDTYGMRTERLIAIQGNFALIQPELSAPAQNATLAERNHPHKPINSRLKPWADGRRIKQPPLNHLQMSFKNYT